MVGGGAFRASLLVLALALTSCARWWPTNTCNSDADCVAPHVCVDRACVEPPPVGHDAGTPDAGPHPDAGSCGAVLLDPQNCGLCGHVCPTAQPRCIDGECQASNDCLLTGCPTPRTYCDTTTGVCRSGCSTDAVCGMGRLCDDATHECVHVPSSCLVDACPAGHRCDASSGMCQPGCATNEDCAPEATCTNGSCVPPVPSCAAGFPCPGGTYCDPSTQTCLPGCADGVPCVNGGTCDVSTHSCGSPPTLETCVTNGCVVQGEYCDPLTGGCKPGCAGTSDCHTGQYCDPTLHSCKAPPATCPIAGCPYGSQCSGGACVPGCSTAVDCGYGAICVSGQCAPAQPDCSITGCTAGQYCDPLSLSCKAGCTSNANCPGSSACSTTASQCVAIPTDCTTQRCRSGQTCDPDDGQCKPTCGGGGSCANGGTCDPGTNTCGTTCTSATCTAGNRCDPVMGCVPGCSVPAFPCPQGEECDAATHSCVTPSPMCSSTCSPGDYCDVATSGRCVPGCDATQLCPTGQLCAVAAHACYAPDTCGPSGRSDCGGTCTDISSDPKNCGDCGVACPAATPGCMSGICYDSCQAQGKTNCNGTCSDMVTDPMDCGGCGITCPTAMPACMAGACYDPCPAEGKTNCSGTCSDTRTDPMNCGRCGGACPVSMPACMAGTCYDPCPAEGKTNCSGTCATLTSDTANCGACGHACPEATPLCLNSACTACPAGQAFCSGGCVTLDTTSNCGSCGNACAAGAACASGTCACEPNETVCNDACTDTASDQVNCGACGNICASGMTCSGSVCQCPAGNVMCNGRCRDIRSDDNNCGGCGLACPSGCTAGECIAVLWSSDAYRVPDGLASDGEYLYVAEEGIPNIDGSGPIDGTGDIVRITLAGGAAVTLASSLHHPTKIVLAGGRLFWTDDLPAGFIESMAVDGSDRTTVASNQNEPASIAADAANIYWTDTYQYMNNAGAVVQQSLAGGSPITLASRFTHGAPTEITVGAHNVYWAEYNAGTILAVPINGGSVQTISTDSYSFGAWGLALDPQEQNLFWIDINGPLLKQPLSGGAPVTLSFGGQVALAADSTCLYWATGTPGAVQSVELLKTPVGGGPLVNLGTVITPVKILLDSTSVYFTSTTDLNATNGAVFKVTPK